MWWVSGWFIAYSVSIFGLVFGIQRLRSQRKGKKTMSLDELSVVIPFRDEAENLVHFINCIRSQRYQPEQWIFVNDHSTDSFPEIFASMKGFPIRVLHLPEDQQGKKRALRYGMDHVRTEFCLTMDADVVFGKEYIQSMMVMPEADMVILPVRMTSKRWWHAFFTLEYLFTSLLNRGTAGWSRPVNCSGANLLVRLSAFDAVDDIDDHDHILSGDDIYALRAFREGNKQIELVELESLTVSTATPYRFSEVMEQRVRWLGKTGNVGDNLNNFLGIWAVALHLVYAFLGILTYFSGAIWFTLAIFLMKSILDGILVRSAELKWDREMIIGLILFELFYPLYLFALLGSLMFNQPEWKGR